MEKQGEKAGDGPIMSLSGWISTSNCAFLPPLAQAFSHWLPVLSQGKSQLILKLDPCPSVDDNSSREAVVVPPKAVSSLVSSNSQKARGFPAETPRNKVAELLVFLPRWTMLSWKETDQNNHEFICSPLLRVASKGLPQSISPHQSSGLSIALSAFLSILTIPLGTTAPTPLQSLQFRSP